MANQSAFVATIILALAVLSVSAEYWEDFRVKYDLLPAGHFNRMPKTEREAKAQGWIAINFDCMNSGSYLGFRYVKEGDYSLVLSYDVMGIISGLQMLLPHSKILSPNNTFRFNEVPMFNNATFNGEEHFVLTAYFVDPAIICTTGRNESDLIDIGTGSNMIWFQNGPTYDTILELPTMRADAIAQGWSINNCFLGMGSHNWYRMEDYEATNCDVQVPVFGLYNKATELLGFGFSVPGTVVNAHFENPPTVAVELITGDVAPACLAASNDLIGSTTMHVYFVDFPYLIGC